MYAPLRTFLDRFSSKKKRAREEATSSGARPLAPVELPAANKRHRANAPTSQGLLDDEVAPAPTTRKPAPTRPQPLPPLNSCTCAGPAKAAGSAARGAARGPSAPGLLGAGHVQSLAAAQPTSFPRQPANCQRHPREVGPGGTSVGVLLSGSNHGGRSGEPCAFAACLLAGHSCLESRASTSAAAVRAGCRGALSSSADVLCRGGAAEAARDALGEPEGRGRGAAHVEGA